MKKPASCMTIKVIILLIDLCIIIYLLIIGLITNITIDFTGPSDITNHLQSFVIKCSTQQLNISETVRVFWNIYLSVFSNINICTSYSSSMVMYQLTITVNVSDLDESFNIRCAANWEHFKGTNLYRIAGISHSFSSFKIN